MHFNMQFKIRERRSLQFTRQLSCMRKFRENSENFFRSLSDGLFIESTREVSARYPTIQYEEVLIDNTALQVTPMGKMYL
jgi:isocitrate/isopropylmalate dehydrogenase